MTTIGVTGATGQLGRLVVRELAARGAGAAVVALARTPAKGADLGVTVREADYTRPGTLARALDGIDTLLLISSNQIGQRAAQHRQVIAAARAAGVSWVVYTSLLHADRSPLGLADEHRATEAELAASGLPFTVLRNGWYTENYTASVPGAVAGGAFLGCAGDGRISSAARADYAAAAAAVVTGQGHVGRVYELAGDEAYTLSGLAAEISRQVGKVVPYTNLTEAGYAAALAGLGLPAPVAAAYASFDTGAAAGALFDGGRELSRLIGRPTTPLSASVAAALGK